MKRAVFIAVLFFALLVAPAVSYENDDDDDGDFQNVADELDNKLQSFEEDNNNDNDNDNEVAVNSNADDDDDDDDDDNDEAPAVSITSKISSDVASLEEGLDATKLSFSARTQVENNLEAIKSDAKKYAASESASRRAALAEAMKDRMKALRMQLEESDSHNAARTKVSHDISALRASVESSAMPAASRSRAFHVLEEMSEKVNAGASASTLRAETQKLRSIISSATAHKTRSFEEEAVTAKVSTDISSLEETLDSSDLPASVVSKAKLNLAAIKKDTVAIASAEGTRRSDLSRAIKMRMDALKLMLEEDSHPVRAVHADAAVARDVNNIESILSQAHLSSSQKKEAMNNLEAIKRDAEEMPSASPRRAKALKQAMSLRMKALQRELA